ncbi:ribosomal protein S18 acetylase RimI-like enzyme [Rhodobacter aestuarii]|uniref:Ribosomal protein S18 acetylase RimI n=1 Tax=Rhodobacter aestuarii TaxID=453582 RepID=A0A1N7PHC7_9RHOB|nr:GNAT family N-acetyltransferase [Rhodobacter aestuarii]PTV94413.1 ribosomal protein S18 acetylase RimI-like enzyme [Rhodobacter aestuarii]SIT10001.1 Ribosomal protein S18 acetylase RimI [Rhodobacter aestuarii]
MIRPATAEDLPAMAALIAAAIRDLCHADHHGQPNRMRPWIAANDSAALAARIKDPAQRLFVTQAAGLAAVGGLDWRDQPEGRGRISLLFVDPAQQGKGHARTLLAALEAELRALGRTEGRLTATNTARGFYLSQGWTADPAASGGALLGHALQKALA